MSLTCSPLSPSVHTIPLSVSCQFVLMHVHVLFTHMFMCIRHHHRAHIHTVAPTVAIASFTVSTVATGARSQQHIASSGAIAARCVTLSCNTEQSHAALFANHPFSVHVMCMAPVWVACGCVGCLRMANALVLAKTMRNDHLRKSCSLTRELPFASLLSVHMCAWPLAAHVGCLRMVNAFVLARITRNTQQVPTRCSVRACGPMLARSLASLPLVRRSHTQQWLAQCQLVQCM
jgi:hypothetical protein